MQRNQATRGIGHGEIMEALAAGLPGATAHLRMLPPGRAYVEAGEVPAEALESGVLVVLFEDGERIYTCLIKRPAHMKVHAGQVGFPGGAGSPLIPTPWIPPSGKPLKKQEFSLKPSRWWGP